MGNGGKYDLCAFCPELCMDRCVVATVTGANSASPRYKMTLAWMLERGLVKPDRELAEALYLCTGCLACSEACKFHVDVEDGLREARANLVQAGVTPFPRELFEGDTDRLVQAQAALIPKEMFVPEAQAVLFPGCHALLDRGGAGVTDLLAVFRNLGIEFVGASRDAAQCCGYPLWAAGYVSEFARQARRVSALLRRYRMVVVASPCCAHTMRNLYPLVGVTEGPRVTLALDLVAPLVMRRDARPLEMNLAWHDSCFLGRHLGQYDAPRALIAHANGRPPVELQRHGSDAPCCGAGGVLDRTHKEVAAAAARRLGDQAAGAGAKALVVAGAPCVGHLAASGVEVMDMMGLLRRYLEGQGTLG